MNLFIYGDSITLGLWDSRGGWADRIKAYVQSEEASSGIKNYHTVYNLGVDGNTTKQVLERFEAETNARMWPGSENAFIFAIGTNDTLYRKSTLDSTPETYREQLEELIRYARGYSKEIYFVELLPVDESLANPLANSSTGKSYSNDRIQLFNRALHAICHTAQLTCFKLYEKFETEGPNSVLIDGLHPNSKGHELIFKEITPTIRELLGYQSARTRQL